MVYDAHKVIVLEENHSGTFVTRAVVPESIWYGEVDGKTGWWLKVLECASGEMVDVDTSNITSMEPRFAGGQGALITVVPPGTPVPKSARRMPKIDMHSTRCNNPRPHEVPLGCSLSPAKRTVRACGKCGSKMEFPGPCPVCHDVPFTYQQSISTADVLSVITHAPPGDAIFMVDGVSDRISDRPNVHAVHLSPKLPMPEVGDWLGIDGFNVWKNDDGYGVTTIFAVGSEKQIMEWEIGMPIGPVTQEMLDKRWVRHARDGQLILYVLGRDKMTPPGLPGE